MEEDVPPPATPELTPDPQPVAAELPAGPAWMRERKRALAFEVIVVLGVAWFGSYFTCLAEVTWPAYFAPATPYWYGWWSTMLGDLPLIALVILLARRGGDTWRDLGFVRPRLLVDGLIVVGCFVGDKLASVGYSLYVYPLLRSALPVPDEAQVWSSFPKPQGPWEWGTWPIDVLVSAAFQEILMRSYLLPRLVKLLDSELEAILLGAALFAAAHLYQGMEGTILSGLFGAVYGILFLATRRIWPLVLAHTLNNVQFSLLHWLEGGSP